MPYGIIYCHIGNKSKIHKITWATSVKWIDAKWVPAEKSFELLFKQMNSRREGKKKRCNLPGVFGAASF